MKIRLLSLVLACWMISCGGDKQGANAHSAEAEKTEVENQAESPAEVSADAKAEKTPINYDLANIKKNSNVDLMQRARQVNILKMEINNLKRDMSKTLKQLEE